MSITILLEIGHDASLRTKTTPEGFTHDWEVFVKGCNGTDIHHYVDKVVFHLHETFPKPKRVVKEPPYSLRTSGYAGFTLPIDIYLRNNQEPKKIRFNYDLGLQPAGPPIHKVQKEKYTFFNPSEEFKNKLLKGGAVPGSGVNAFDVSDNHKAVDDKVQMTSKPKLSGTDVAKKHKLKPEEPRNTDFENLFGPPIKKTSRAPDPPPKPKEIPKSSSSTDKDKVMDKDKSDKPKSKPSPKEKEKDKDKSKDRASESGDKKKEEKRRSKDDKSKDRDRAKEKSSKKDRDKEKEKSPAPAPRPRSPSPKRSPKRAATPPPAQKQHSSSSSSTKDSNKEEKKDRDKDRSKEDKKSKKDKREHRDSKHRDKDKEKDHKEHKSRDSKSSKEKEKEASNVKVKEPSPVPIPVVTPQQTHKTDRKVREKESPRESQPKEEEKLEKTDRVRHDQSEDRQKQHKHKKKDRKEKREDKRSRNEKVEKQSSSPPSVMEVDEEPAVAVSSTRDVDKSNLFGSPSMPMEVDQKAESSHSFQRDDESSDDSMKISSSRASSPSSRAPSRSPSPVPVETPRKPEPEKRRDDHSVKKKEKKDRKKDKKSDRDGERRRKRKAESSNDLDSDEPPEQVQKLERPSSSNNTRKEKLIVVDGKTYVGPNSDWDVEVLRDLQRRIMDLKESDNLQQVVTVIADTGLFEVNANTFDFDLCLLDNKTIKQLLDIMATEG
ncbi:ENL/AF9-related super elongation complex transcription factor [Leptinotarsa decemlineata]|uniref:ENL/AF9-related super elongation complex transcription factor n=1 Tax=Leptinotarsa decemlineata TaxID=7539 RepID=UPI003D305712